MEAVFEVELGHAPKDERKAYTALAFPATPYEQRDALDRIRVPKDGNMTVEILDAIPDVDFLKYRTKRESHKAPELQMFNALAEKIAQMSFIDRCAFEGMVRMERQKGEREMPIARLYDLASSTDCCHVVPEVSDDASLGKFYVDGGFLPEYEEAPEYVLERLDYEKIGREAREGEGGVFLSKGGYVVQHEEYVEAAKDFVPQEPDYIVLVEVSQGEKITRLKMPAAPHEMDGALDAVGAAEWQDVTIQCLDCKAPVLIEAVTECGSVEQANRAAQMLENLNEKQTAVFKALLEVRGVSTLEDALEMIDCLDQYILSPEFASPEDVGLSCLQTVMGDDEAALVLPHVNLYSYGVSLIQRFNYSMTTYGAIERRDGEPVRESDRQTVEAKTAENHPAKPRRKRREPSR